MSLFDIKPGVAQAMIKGEIDITKTSLFQEGRKAGERIGFQKGEKKGEKKVRIEELRKAILLAVQLKFEKGKVGLVSKKLKRIDNIRELRRIYTNAIKSKSWQEFFSFLHSESSQNHRNNNNNRRNKR